MKLLRITTPAALRFMLCAICIFLLAGTASAQRTVKYEGKEEAVEEKELRILSWNIQMLPRLLLKICRGPMRRSRLIPGHVINDQPDIIVFQEAFDPRARRILKRGLKDTFPYRIGPANRAGFRLKTNSGIIIYSKIPIKELGTIDFNDCEDDDCLARKGALLVEAEWQGVSVQVLGTHLEAGGPPWIKKNQYAEIRGLIDAHRKDGVPQFLCGDFNTNHDDPELYPEMLKTLDVEDGPFFSELKFTDDPILNDMNYSPGKTEDNRDVIDYVFYRANGVQPHSMKRYVRQYQQRWSEKYKDLSDHNAVLMRVIFK